MSRCFPFPPPGYERKLVVDDGNLLAKENEKDKKEKKHKKDRKEKKEGREKDKEGSKKRHKDKKEKHKHRDKDKKKDKKRSRDEKRSEGESSILEKVGSNSPQSNQLTGNSSVEDLGCGISYAGGASTGNQIFHKIKGADQGSAELLNRVVDSVRGYCSEGKNGVYQKANGQRENSKTRYPKVAIVCDLNVVEQRRAELVRPVETDIGKTSEGMEKQKLHKKDKKGEKSKDKDAKRFGGQSETFPQEKFGCHGAQVDWPKEADTFVQELGRRIRDENGAMGSQVIAKPNATTQKRAQYIGKVATGNPCYSSQTKESSDFRNSIHREDNGQNDINQSRGPKNAVVNNFKTVVKRGGGMVGPMRMGKKEPIEGIGRNEYGGNSVYNKVMKAQPEDEGRNKATMEAKVKQGSDFVTELSRLETSVSNFTHSSKQYASSVGNKADEGITAKRKEREADGFLRDDEIQPNKLLKTVASSQSTGENGSKLQSCTTITLSLSKQGSTNNSLKLDSQEHKANGKLNALESPLGSTKSPSFTTARTNGTVPVHGSPLGSAKPSLAPAKAKHKEKPFRKPWSPHPDTKYLGQILSVPKIEGWSEFDDLEWLFDSKSLSSDSKETVLCASDGGKGERQVWAKAVHIESADIFALPYVIPY